MPRKKRNVKPGQDVHTIFRSVDNSFLFLPSSAQTCAVRTFWRVHDKYQAPLYAWTGMSNHQHLLNQAPLNWPEGEGATDFEKTQARLHKPIPIGHMFRDCFSLFARKLNILKKRVGGVIRDRTKTVIIQDYEQALTVIIYIFLNPVRAGMVKHPKDYPYSNYSQYAFGKEKPFKGLFSYHPAYLALGKTWVVRQRNFRSLVEAALKEWANQKCEGISGSHAIGRGKGEKQYHEFHLHAHLWLLRKGFSLSAADPPA